MESESERVQSKNYQLTCGLIAVLVILTVVRVAGPLQKSNYSNKILRLLFRE